MKKSAWLSIALVWAILILIPFLADNASNFHFFFKLILIPVACVLAGGYAGWKIRSRWALPLIPALLNLVFALPFGQLSDSGTVLFSGFLLLLGGIAMALMGIARSYMPNQNN